MLEYLRSHIAYVGAGAFPALAIIWRFFARPPSARGSIFAGIGVAVIERLNIPIRREIITRLVLRNYADRMVKGVADAMIVPGRMEITIPISRCYIPLSLDVAARQRSYTGLQILDVDNRLRIIGDPGSGKSTMTQRIYLELLELARSKPARAKIPIRIELHKLDLKESAKPGLNRGERFYELLKKAAVRDGSRSVIELFDTVARTSGLVVMLDGLDQIASTDYAYSEEYIIALSEYLAAKSSNNQIVITMRTQFYQSFTTNLTAIFPVVAALKPFSPTDIYLFLQRWPFKTANNTEFSRIFDDLTSRPTLREMCRTPLMLSMYVAETQNPGFNSPDTRTDFYMLVVNELLKRREQRQVGTSASNATQSAEFQQRKHILGRVAYDHLCDPSQHSNWLEWNTTIQTLRTQFGFQTERAVEYLRDLCIRTGIISEERREEKISFTHLTFCEFMAAHHAALQVETGLADLLNAQAQMQQNAALRSRLMNSIPFAVGLAPPYKRRVIFDRLPEFSIDLAILTFLETKQYGLPSWSQLVDRFEQELRRSLAEADTGPLRREVAERWSRLIHLLLMALEECSDIAKVTRTIPIAVSPVDFVRGLLDRAGATQVILKGLAEEDANVAIGIGRLMGINIIEKVPDIVVRHADQPYFFARLIDLMSQSEGTDEHSMWTTLIAEAAIFSPRVAAAIADSRHYNFWRKDALRLGHKARQSSTPLRELLCVALHYVKSGMTGRRPLLEALSLVQFDHAFNGNLRPFFYTFAGIFFGFLGCVVFIEIIDEVATSFILDLLCVFVWFGITGVVLSRMLERGNLVAKLERFLVLGIPIKFDQTNLAKVVYGFRFVASVENFVALVSGRTTWRPIEFD